MKATLSGVAAVAALLAAAGGFVFCCFAAASDAQGGLVFIFLGPFILLLLIIAYLIARLAMRASPALAAAVTWSAAAGLAFVVAFFMSALIPGLRAFPRAVVGAVASGYEMATGETPYVAVRKGNDVQAMIREALAQSGGKRLDFASLPAARPWDRMCVLGPRTDNAAARPVLGLKGWDIEMYSKIASSDGIAALVFINGDRVSYVVELPRSEADLAPLSKHCYARDAAVFERTAGASGMPSFAPAAVPRAR